MVLRAIHVYVGATVLTAVAILAFLDWSSLSSLPPTAVIGFAALLILGIFSEASSAFSYDVGPKGGRHSLVFLPLVAAVLLFGPVPAVLFIVITAAATEFAIRRKPWVRALFNTAQYVIATAIGGLVFVVSGGYPLAAAAFESESFDPQVTSVLAFGVSALFLNHLAVAIAIALSERERCLELMRRTLARIGGTVLNDLLVLPVSILVAFLYFELQVAGLLVALLPLLFIRYSYIAKFRLEAANRDLLRVLVKTIETRDPYTSGHSLRVQSLAKSIGEAINLGLRRMTELEVSALLHDIGKIELVYEEILQKPGALSHTEQQVIQSHVDRGVEILTSLSSFSARILAGIRHHHELYDGSGYPDGLSGDRIPLFARIIKVSDAIDAMLSSRPYRNALSVGNVRSELSIYAGKHFDPRLVAAVLNSSIIEEHAAMMELARSLSEDVQSPSPSTGRRPADYFRK